MPLALDLLRLAPAELSCWWPADYKLSLQGKEGEERQYALNACHSRGAWQLQKLCFANGGEQALLEELRFFACSGSMTKGCAAAGIYIKLGQHVAQLVSWKMQLSVMAAACCLRLCLITSVRLPCLQACAESAEQHPDPVS